MVVGERGRMEQWEVGCDGAGRLQKRNKRQSNSPVVLNKIVTQSNSLNGKGQLLKGNRRL